MDEVTLRITLTDQLNNIKVISEPGGWDAASIGLERHPQLLSLVEYYKSSFQLYGSNGSEDGGRDWVLAVEKRDGPDVLIAVLVEVDSDDNGNFRTAFNGNLGVGLFVETLDQDHLLQVVFANSDFWSKIMARWQSPVDLRSLVDLDGNAVTATPKFTLPLPNQAILKQYQGLNINNLAIDMFDPDTSTGFLYFDIDFDTDILNEIETKYQYGINPQQNLPAPLFTVSEAGGMNANLSITISIENVPPNVAKENRVKTAIGTIHLYIQRNDDAPIQFTETNRNVGLTYNRNDGILITLDTNTVTDFTYAGFFQLNKNDSIRIYGKQLGIPQLNPIFIWGSTGWKNNNFQFTFGQEQDNRINAFQGYLDPTSGVPATEEDGITSIKVCDSWIFSAPGIIMGVTVERDWVLQALVNVPGSTRANWWIDSKSLYSGLEAYGPNNHLNIIFNTTTPDSTTEAFHTHDMAAGILDRISGRQGLFYSEYFGHQWTSRVYPGTGCGSLKANMKGLHVRGYSLVDKPFAPCMQDWVDGVNPIDCIGMGYEKLADVDVVRCERAPYFFDDSSMSILFSNVQTIKRTYDPNWQFNSIDYGYAKWQSQAANGVGSPSGIDDPQSQGTRNTIFKIIGKKLKIWSTWLAAGIAIETTRRQSKVQSANYTYDDDVIVICLHSNGDGTFTPELDENYSSITGLTNKTTRYNIPISSTRNFIRWLPYLSGCLQSYLSAVFTFATGQGNSTMTSTKTTSCPGDETGNVVSENGAVAVGTDFLFLPMPFEIDHFMDFDDYEILVANKNLAIGISQTGLGHKPFFIDKLNYVIATGLVHVIAWPKEAFDIVVPETFSTVPSGTSVIVGKYFEQPYFETQFE